MNISKVSEETIDNVIVFIEKNKGTSLKKIATHLNLKENEIKPIIEILQKYNFINNSDKYRITQVGEDYLKIKS